MNITNSSDFLLIPSEDMKTDFSRILIRYGFPEDKAKMCAAILTDNSLDGVYSHGVNRFARLIENVRNGYVKPRQFAACKSSVGNIEQWDGKGGVGPINAHLCTERVMHLASQYGIGCVALANTNHWYRGGTYGWLSAKAGFVFIGWSNTIANMPPWGAVDPKLGNNPLVIAVPYGREAIVLDMAMSQYSYGALESHQLKGEKLGVAGGYDLSGNISTDPAAISESQRTLPIGYWKGSGLSLLLDILGTVLSGGLSTAEITKQGSEYNVSQVFIAIDIKRLANFKSLGFVIDQIISDYHHAIPVDPNKKVRYPGEQVLKTRAQNIALGIPVHKDVWKKITQL